jgi:CBS domain-containing protein
MTLDKQSIGTPAIEDAIDRHPLTVPPETPLVKAITLMSQTKGHSCPLTPSDSFSASMPIHLARSSCVLIMEGDEILGILTERDIVRLTALGIDITDTKINQVMAHPVITLAQTELQDIFAPLFLFRRYQMRHLVIVDDGGKLVGVVSSESIRRVLRPVNLLKVRRVAEVMSFPVTRAAMNASVLDIAQLMAKHRVSCVVIIEQDEDFSLPVGIVTERDIVQFQTLQVDLSRTSAERVMSTPLFLLNPEDSLWTAHLEMQRRQVRRLVVSWSWGSELGIVTQTSLLRIFDPVEMYRVVQTLQRTVEQLVNQSCQMEVPSLNSPHPLRGNAPDRLRFCLSTLQTHLENLRDQPQLPAQQQQAIVSQALEHLAHLHTLLDPSVVSLSALESTALQ